MTEIERVYLYLTCAIAILIISRNLGAAFLAYFASFGWGEALLPRRLSNGNR